MICEILSLKKTDCTKQNFLDVIYEGQMQTRVSLTSWKGHDQISKIAYLIGFNSMMTLKSFYLKKIFQILRPKAQM